MGLQKGGDTIFTLRLRSLSYTIIKPKQRNPAFTLKQLLNLVNLNFSFYHPVGMKTGPLRMSFRL